MSAAAGTQLPRASHALPGPYRSRTLCSKIPQLGFQLGSGPMFYVKMFGRLSFLRSQSSRPIQHAFSVGCYHRRVRQSRQKFGVSREKLDRSRETICTSWKPSETRNSVMFHARSQHFAVVQTVNPDNPVKIAPVRFVSPWKLL